MEPNVSALEHSLRRPMLERDLPRADLGAVQKKIVDVVSRAFHSESFMTIESFRASPNFNQTFTITFNFDFAANKGVTCTVTREKNLNIAAIHPHKNQVVLLDEFQANPGIVFHGRKSADKLRILTAHDVHPILKEVVETAVNVINEKRSG